MILKKKICVVCELPSFIYKNVEGEKYCKSCYYRAFPPKKIVKVSKKQKSRNAEYMVLRNQYLEEHTTCEVCKLNLATEVHHKSGRIGDNLFKDFCAICRECHNLVHDKNLGI